MQPLKPDRVIFVHLMSRSLRHFLEALLLLMPLFASAQTEEDSTASDSVQAPVPPSPYPAPPLDTLSFDRIERNTALENPFRFGLGNLGQDSYSLLPRVEGPKRIGHRPGIPRNPYDLPTSPPPAFDVRYPVTRAEYSMGSEEEEYFNITHTQNITPRWNVALRYRKIGSPGPYARQATSSGDFSFSSNYREAAGYYQVRASFRANRTTLQQNGGIEDPQVFEEDEQSNRGAFRVRLDQAESRSRSDEIRLDHALFPTGRDFGDDPPEEELKLGIFHQGVARDMRMHYRDENPQGGFYERILIDSSLSDDSSRFRKLEQSLGAILQHRKEGKLVSELRLGYRHAFLGNRLMGSERGLSDGALVLRGERRSEAHALQGKLAYGIEGYGKGDRLLSGEWRYNTGMERIADSLAVALLYKERRRAYMEERYRSNHFRWEKEFPSTRTLHARMRWGEPEERDGASVSHTRVGNALFFDREALPQRAEKELLFARAQLRKRIEFGKWGVDARAVWQKEWNSDILRLPEYLLRGGIFFESWLFNEALKGRFGLRCTYFTAYKGDAYMPATRRFYLQDEKKLGDYPFLDLYFHGKVSNILFFVELDHGNAGLNGYRYYGTPHYPLRDRMIRFGLKWDIFN